MSVYAISVSVNFLVSLSLLAGVRLEKRWLLLPWMAWTTLSLIVSQMAVFYTPNKVRLEHQKEDAVLMIVFADDVHHPRHLLHRDLYLLHHVCLLVLPDPLGGRRPGARPRCEQPPGDLPVHLDGRWAPGDQPEDELHHGLPRAPLPPVPPHGVSAPGLAPRLPVSRQPAHL